MSLLSFFTRKSSAPVARDRLQILLAHERGGGLAGQSDLVAKLQEEILAVIARHIAVDREKVQIKLDRGGQVSTLEIDIEVPDLAKAASEHKKAQAEKQADTKPATDAGETKPAAETAETKPAADTAKTKPAADTADAATVKTAG